MANLFSNLFQPRKPRPGTTAIPVHWLDTTPIDSTDVPCTIESLDAKVRVCGLFAEVVQTIVIANPNRRPLSVAVTIPLPDHATVSGYALDVDGRMVDGVVVPKEQARVVFETEQRRGADPGLVEAVKGNVYNTRVYPVPAGSSRTVRLRYVAPLLLDSAGSALLDLPMPSEHLAKRTLRIDVEAIGDAAPTVEGLNGAQPHITASCWSVESEEQDFVPAERVRVRMPELAPSFALLERDGEGTVWFSVSAAAPDADPASAEPISAVTVLWDVSGSRAQTDHEREFDLLKRYCETDSVKALHLVAFADVVLESREFSNADELVEHVKALRYDGGTNLRELAGEMERLAGMHASDPGVHAFVLFTDGLDTLSGETFDLPDSCPVAAIVAGRQRDMESTSQACKGLAFDLDSAPRDASELAWALCPDNPVRNLALQGEGIEDVLDIGQASGNRRSAIGKLVGNCAEITLGADGTTLKLSADDARDGNVLASAWAARKIAQLSPRATDNADELLALGQRFGIVSPVTSLLVLETLDQWLDHDIEPPATLPEMHAAWHRAQEGKMRLSSDEAEKARHRSHLAFEWKELIGWWKRDYSAPARTVVPDRPGFCHICGAALLPDARFCAQCGSSVNMTPVAPDTTGSFAPIPAPDSAPMPFGEMRSERFQATFAPAPLMAMAEPSGSFEDDFAYASPAFGGAFEDTSMPEKPSFSVAVRPWMPDAPYLKALDEALGSGIEAARSAYHDQRAQFSTSPSFFLDCAGWFLAHGDDGFGLRVLSNLAELRIEDAALLRVMAWRLREAGQLERALPILRRVLALRSEDSQSYRDVALVLDELARKALAQGDEVSARAYAQEAGELYRKIAFTPWQRRPMAVSLFAVEEYNILRNWAESQTWANAPELPSLGVDLEGVLDCDLRVTLAWDADETDVDLHVTEPSGEEAYYGHRLTFAGGRVSEDITDGYGPELYEIRKAQEGAYKIRAHYFASHQESVFGPATCTLTVYTDWGRPNQAQQITSMRLDKERQMTEVGTATYGAETLSD